MTDTAVAVRDEPTLTPFEVIERVITSGDLARMTPEDRIAFYWRTCESLGLNPLTRPFEFIQLNGKLTMYTRRDATDQLRRVNSVSVTSLRRERDDDLGLVTVYAAVVDARGRMDESSGVVSIKGLAGEHLANALMKAETKAKRRATLSLVGLGFLDESEVDDRGDVEVDPTTGVISERPKPKTLLEQVKAQQEAMASDGEVAESEAVDVSADEIRAEIDEIRPMTEAESAAIDADVVEPDPDDVEVGEFVADPPVAFDVSRTDAGVSKDAFTAALKANRIAPEYALERSRVMFPRGPADALTDEQRAALLNDLLS